MESMPIRCSAIIEMAGKPKEHVEKTIREYVSSLRKQDGIVILKEGYSEAKENSGLWAAFVEIEAIMKGLTRFINFCLNYMPSSVEIIKPESFQLKNNELTSFLNELQSKLHSVDVVAKNLRLENDFLKKNMNSLVKNTILLSLRVSGLKKPGLAKTTGIEEKELDAFLESLIKDGKIKKEEDRYSLVAK